MEGAHEVGRMPFKEVDDLAPEGPRRHRHKPIPLPFRADGHG